MKQLTHRQNLIFSYIQKHPEVSNKEILGHLAELNLQISRVTLFRELDELVLVDLIIRKGAGRTVTYAVKTTHPLLKHVDIDGYFESEMDDRVIKEGFNFDVFSLFDPFFSEDELRQLEDWTAHYQRNKGALSKEQIKREDERLTIELSWKSSQIEGNTYTLLDAEALIKQNREAPGHDKAEAQMILNHKFTMDYIAENLLALKRISISHIEQIHGFLVKGLDISQGFRTSGVRITGTNFSPIDNQHEAMITLIGHYKDPYHAAASAIILTAYIQPFMDGNKRTSRLLGNGILMAHGACPLSYRSVDPVDYKKAMLLFYEQNNLAYFKDLFMSQYGFSSQHYYQNL
jgi:fido (protein-threonine AMPylation protein)